MLFLNDRTQDITAHRPGDDAKGAAPSIRIIGKRRGCFNKARRKRQLRANGDKPFDALFPVDAHLGWSPFTWPVNLCGLAAATVPCGRDSSGLPIGLQMIAPWMRESSIIALDPRPHLFEGPGRTSSRNSLAVIAIWPSAPRLPLPPDPFR
ncbi:amidase family protein [Mesorhizobium sp. M0152]|uniref:amidase family protein n=1 Tax=Mesorhizobium sp. M0152 TaxID=2956898 RepID=UPI00333B7CD9